MFNMLHWAIMNCFYHLIINGRGCLMMLNDFLAVKIDTWSLDIACHNN